MLQNLRQGAMKMKWKMLCNISKFQGLSPFLRHLEMPFVECVVYMFVYTTV